MTFVLLLSFALIGAPADHSDVLKFPLPDARASNVNTWLNQRRPEILNVFADQVYGKTPATVIPFTTAVSVDEAALGGKAIRKQITLTFHRDALTHQIHILLYLPANAKAPMPVIVGLNFSGNQTVAADPSITLPDVPPAKLKARGAYSYRWQVAKLLEHGYGLATVCYQEIEPDFNGGLNKGIRKFFPNEKWGALGAWAWGLSRIADYLVTDSSIDPKRIGLIGFSRLGKSALWAAAQDERFALVLSNESGVGGASLYRAKTGETIEHLNTAFPHWFCENFDRYTGHPDQVPVDGNLLLSLIAPRPLYVASADKDTYSNPQAEFLSASWVGKIYQLFGRQGLDTDIMPPLNQPIMHTVAYHVRSGVHEVTEYDWDQYLKFIDLHFGASISSAVSLAHAGNYLDAEQVLRTLAQDHPEDADAQAALGELCYRYGYYQASLKPLALAIALRPQDQHSKILQAVADFKVGAADDAVKATKELDAQSVHDIDLSLTYAQYLYEKGEIDAALTEARSTIGFAPQHPIGYLWLSRILLAKHEVPEAQQAAERSVALAPQLPFARNLLVRIYRMEGRVEDSNRQADWLRDYDARKATR